jgi:sulfotransferase family protein
MPGRLRERRARCVIVSGMARSGSSWLGKGLSFAPGFTYYREPDNYHEVPEAKERFAWLYLTRDRDDPEYYHLMARACTGRVATAFTLCDNPGPLLKHLGPRGRRVGSRFPALFMRHRNVLIKLVYANLNLEWLAARFPRAQQVCILRHPCGQFESWRRLGWEPEPARLLGIPHLMAEHLQPFEVVLREARTFWERAGALWGAMGRVLHRQTPRDSSRIIIGYEWLCANPVSHFQELYGRLGLRWTERPRSFLVQADHGGDDRPYSLARQSEAQVDIWRQRLSAEEVAQCRRFVEPFGLPYYPDFDPRGGDADIGRLGLQLS